MSQSSAIEKYIARLVGLYPRDPIDALVCDVVREHFAEAMDATWKGGFIHLTLAVHCVFVNQCDGCHDAYAATFAKDKKEEAIAEFKAVTGPKFLA